MRSDKQKVFYKVAQYLPMEQSDLWFLPGMEQTTILTREHMLACMLSEEIGHISQFLGY